MLNLKDLVQSQIVSLLLKCLCSLTDVVKQVHFLVPLERGDSPLTDNFYTQDYLNACKVSEKWACLSRFPFY